MSASDTFLISRTSGILRPDPRRTVLRFFVPGHELMLPGQGRVNPIINRILAMSPETAASVLTATIARFADRHEGLVDTFERHFDLVAHRVRTAPELSRTAALLMGAYFTQEYAVESAALFNPSIVAHPDQSGAAADELRVLLSLRAVGEGHLSSIEFRGGLLARDGRLILDEGGRDLHLADRSGEPLRQAALRRSLGQTEVMSEDMQYVLSMLPDPFTSADLDRVLASLQDQQITRHSAPETIGHLRAIAEQNYTARFPVGSAVADRVLMPAADVESHGMEDARFVRFTDDDGSVTYLATYTAFDGRRVRVQLLRTDDFGTFHSSPLIGVAAANKGVALFPRRIDGRYVALSRWDRESISVTVSDDLNTWESATTVYRPTEPWEVIQVGNCGSPIETSNGWLVLTHGVGPVRGYAIGALLLDLADPTKVIGHLREPLLVPEESERDGYVPNVAYTCGAIVHGDRLVMPYGSADTAIGVAVIDLPRLIDRLRADRPGNRRTPLS